MTTNITSDTFGSFIASAPVVVVDFSATWCGPCRMFEPILENLSKVNAGKASLGAVDIDKEPGLAAKYGISAVPTLLFFVDGQKVETLAGLHPEAKLQAMIDDLSSSYYS